MPKIILILIILTGCQTAYVPAEDRCHVAGLQIQSMKVGENYQRQQEVKVECIKQESLLK